MTDIVVVGAGPTGLTLACSLHHLGVPCRLIDQGPGPTVASRALGMFTRSVEVLESFGAAETAIARGHRIEITNLYSGRRRIGRLATGSLTGTKQPVVLAIPQYVTERLLQERLEELGGEVERETVVCALRQTPGRDRVELTVDGRHGRETVEAAWVVGADGAHSSVRKAAGIDFLGRTLKNVFVIVDAFVDHGPAYNQVHYYVSPQGLTVVSPLPDGSYRFAASMDHFIGDGGELGLDTVQALLDVRVGGGIRVRELRDAGWGVRQVRPHTRIARTFRAGRCVLAGDAAHVYSPLGGQGMNGGIQDAHNLAWKLARVSTGRACEALLDSYAVERRNIAHVAQRTVAQQMTIGSVRARPATALRDGIVGSLSKSGALERYMLPESVMLKHRYPSAENPGIAPGRCRGPQGKRIPDVTLVDGVRRPQPLFDILHRQPYTLLALSPPVADSARVDDLFATVRARYGEEVAVSSVSPGSNRALHRFLRAKAPSLCLVRYDEHIAFFSGLDDGASLLAHLDGLLAAARKLAPTPSPRSPAPRS